MAHEMPFVVMSQSDLGKLPHFDGTNAMKFAVWVQLMRAAFRRCRLETLLDGPDDEAAGFVFAGGRAPQADRQDDEGEDDAAVAAPRRRLRAAARDLGDAAAAAPYGAALAVEAPRVREAARRAIFDMVINACQGPALICCLRAAGAGQDGVRAWRALLENYARRDQVLVQRMRERLLDRLRWRPTETIDTYADAVLALDFELLSIGDDVSVPFDVLRMSILREIRSRFSAPTVRDALETTSLESFFAVLRLDDTASAAVSPAVSGVVAAAAAAPARQPHRGGRRGRGRGGGRGAGRGTDTAPGRSAAGYTGCWVCGDMSHFASECPQRHGPAGAGASRGATGASSLAANAAPDDVLTVNAATVPVFGDVPAMPVLSPTLSPSSTPSLPPWLVDGGAQQHMGFNPKDFTNLVIAKPGRFVLTANGGRAEVVGQGDVELLVRSSTNKLVRLILRDAYLVPSLKLNLLSSTFLTGSSTSVQFVDAGWHSELICNDVVIPVKREHGLLWMHPAEKDTRVGEPSSVHGAVDPSVVLSCVATATVDRFRLMHERFGHPSRDVLLRLCPDDAVLARVPEEVCSACVRAKGARKAMPSVSADAEVALKPGEVIYTDMAGPVEVPSFGGAVYVAIFMDVATRYVLFLGAVRKKSDYLAAFQVCVRDAAANRSGAAPVRIGRGTVLRCDDDSVLTSIAFQTYCSEIGVVLRPGAPYTPERTGKAERLWRTVFAKARALLFAARLPGDFWVLALQHAVYLYNRTPHSALLDKTPLQVLTSKPDDDDGRHLRVFGSAAYVDVHDVHGKLTARARPGIYVGRDARMRCHKVHMLDTRAVVDTIHVVIDETPASRGGPLAVVDARPLEIAGFDVEPAGAEPVPLPVDDAAMIASHAMAYTPFDDEMRLSCDDVVGMCAACALPHMASGVRDPVTVEEAFTGPHAREWMAALEAELAALEVNRTWTIILRRDVPSRSKILRVKVVFTTKYKADASLWKRKARVVAKGCAQVMGIDFDEAYAPVVRMEVVRTVLALAAGPGWSIHQVDVASAFLNGLLDEPVYMDMPPGRPAVDAATGEPLVVCLHKALYGLRQAPRVWNERLNVWLTQQRLERSYVDPCLYVQRDAARERIALILLVWVDDMLLFAPDDRRLQSFKAAMSREFQITDFGEASWFLNMRIVRRDGAISLSQEPYILELLARFGMEHANKAATPLPSALPESGLAGPAVAGDDLSRYRELIGGLLYVATGTRPDIAYAVGQLSRHLAAPLKQHMDAARHVLRYLRGTASLALTYGVPTATRAAFGDASHVAGVDVLVGYADASFGSDVETRRSVGAFVFFLNGAAVAWRSRLQPSVALSTTESEYMALSDAAQEAVYLRKVLAFVGFPQPTTLIFEDNEPCIHIAMNPTVTPRVKHVDIKYHFIRERVASKELMLRHVASEEMLADVLTKSLPKPKFLGPRDRLLGLPSS